MSNFMPANNNRLKQTDYQNRIKIKDAIEFIEANLEKKITLEKAALKSGMSKSSFGRGFKAVTGKSFKKHLTRQRIKKAKFLLENQKMNVTEVGFAVGFNDLSYFDRIFRKHTGTTPSAYVKGDRTEE